MHSLLISNGDITLGNNNRAVFATGRQKLVQDLTIWLLEEYGIGFTTPTFGSFLESYIGDVNPNGMLNQVLAEVGRILQLYQQNQISALQAAQSRNELSNWSKQQVIQQINSISGTAYATGITVSVSITTLANTAVPITLNVTNSGISVS